MHGKPNEYVTAAGCDWLLPLYDPLLRWVVREETFKRRLIAEAQIGPRQRVLDLGCGTGTLTLMIKHHHPDASVHGLDGDPKALRIARRKAEQAGADIVLEQGLSYDLPHADGSFDRVLSSLVFHHLTRQHKVETLAEIRRILKPGGALLIVDFGRPASRVGMAFARLFHHSEHVRAHVEDELTEMIERAGLVGAEEFGRHRILLARLSFHRAFREAAQAAPAT